MEKKYAICRVSAAAMRAENSEKAEMVSQLLFGEWVLILDRIAGWCLVKSVWDDYEGWVDLQQLKATDASVPPGPEKLKISGEWSVQIYNTQNGSAILLTLGAIVETDAENLICLGKARYRPEGTLLPYVQMPNADRIVAAAVALRDAPYLWGGRTPLGIDCSGFVQLCCRTGGLFLPRDAWQQAELGQEVSFAAEARPGDIAFFEDAKGVIIHTGILDGTGHVVHASGFIRRDPFDHQGIFNPESGKYSHNLKIIRRLI
jgi:hypothetical protein